MVERPPKLIKKDEIVKKHRPVLNSNADAKRAKNDEEQAIKDLRRKLQRETENRPKAKTDPRKAFSKLFSDENKE